MTLPSSNERDEEIQEKGESFETEKPSRNTPDSGLGDDVKEVSTPPAEAEKESIEVEPVVDHQEEGKQEN